MHTHTHTHTHTHLIVDQHVVREHRYQCKAASVTASEIEPWVWRIEYSGLMTQTWLNVLRAQEVEATKDARVLLIKMDKVYMITSFAPQMHCGHERINNAPGVMVVREDQYDKWAIYATKMAQAGIMRALFLPWQAEQAQRMVDRLSGATVRRELAGQRQSCQS